MQHYCDTVVLKIRSSGIITNNGSLLRSIIGRRRSSSVSISGLRGTGRFENLKTTHECIIHGHHCSSIVEFSTVVWSGKNCNEFPSSKEFVTIFHNLMRTNHQIQVVTTEELSNNVSAKGKGDSTIIFAPSLQYTSIV